MWERGLTPHEPSATDEGVNLMAKNVFKVFSQFRRAGFTRREAMQLTVIFYENILSTPARGQ